MRRWCDNARCVAAARVASDEENRRREGIRGEWHTGTVTLGRFFTFTLAAVAAALAVLLAFSLAGSRRTLVAASDELRSAAAERVTAQIASHLGQANRAIDDIDGAIATGLASARDRSSMERLLFVEMARHDD